MIKKMADPEIPGKYIEAPQTPAQQDYNGALNQFQVLVDTLGSEASQSGAWKVYIEHLGAAEVALQNEADSS